MSWLETNRASLERAHHEVLEKLDAAPRCAAVTVIATPSGFPSALRAGISVHSRRDPRREASAQVSASIEGAPSSALVLGFGLGYGVEALREKFPGLPILVLEPDADMFSVALESRDLSAILTDPAISFLVASRPEDVSLRLGGLPLARPGFLRLRPAIEADPAWFGAAEEIIHSWLLRRDINTNTLNRFGRLWVRNLAHNITAFADAPGIARLAGAFRGVPALVLAGGPSLDALLPDLPALAQRMLVIAVNTPLKRCRQAGVEPDFTVVVDPQYWASRFLDWTRPGPAPRRGITVAEPSTHPRVFRTPDTCVYLCSSLFPLGEALESAVGEKGKLGAGGSVSTAAWDLARHLGASPIYVAGLDLGFPGLRTHCKGVYTEELWLASSGRLAPLEASSFRSLREIGIFPVRSASGGIAYTDRRMLVYKWWFENQLTQKPDLRSFTLSPHGVAVEGMPLAEPSALLALPVVRREINAVLEQEKRSAAADGGREARLAALREALGELRLRLGEIADCAGEACRKNAAVGELIAKGRDPSAVLAELDALDARILGISERSIAGFLVQSLIQRITAKGDARAPVAEVLADGKELYEGIKESACWQRQLVDRSLAILSSRS